MKPIIKIENLSKQYRLGDIGTGTLSHDLNRWWHTMRGKEDPYLMIGEDNDRANKGSSDYVWAIQDINLDVMPGEVLGIIGKNGAGKSTLLKLLSRVTAPTTGSIKTRGRMASLLEVGTGFHPELTGRENIFLNGAILGMSKKEIRSKFDEIVDFAGCERYIDTPVKRYSSGMYVRLAFAVAAHLEPDILVVDEVLAVGDAEFQKKAIGKMQDVSKNQGRTVLFVSHNMGAVEQLCKRAVLLEKGFLTDDDLNVKKVISKYLFDNQQKKVHKWEKRDLKLGSKYLDLLKFYPTNGINEEVKSIYSRDENINIHFEFNIEELSPLLEIGLRVYDENESLVFVSNQTDTPLINWPNIILGENSLKCKLPSYLLNEGQYRFEFGAYLYQKKYLYYPDNGTPSIYITIQGKLSDSPYWYKKRNGPIAPILQWEKLN